jgi:hypothetical protein
VLRTRSTFGLSSGFSIQPANHPAGLTFLRVAESARSLRSFGPNSKFAVTIFFDEVVVLGRQKHLCTSL